MSSGSTRANLLRDVKKAHRITGESGGIVLD